MTSPYKNIGAESFWRSAVAERSALDPGNLYTPKFPVTRDMRIVTAGSCFAQHVGRALTVAGFNVQDAEPFPTTVGDAFAHRFGYGLYSARYGNIYTTRQLLQLINEMRGSFQPDEPVWERDGRFFDAMRPSVEPGGLDSPETVMAHRALHIANVRRAFRKCDLLVFTFGLTEAWVHNDSGTVYPTAPGTIAGTFDPQVYGFQNFGFEEILADFESVMKILRKRSPGIRFLVTTSPVPLTATATGRHVEVANCNSKSTLRAVCGALYDRHPDVDYFPSY